MTGRGRQAAPGGAGPGCPSSPSAWASALAWTELCADEPGGAARHAAGFADRLAAALVGRAVRREQPGYDVGTELVAADFAAPEALGATIQIIEDACWRDAGLDRADEVRHRLARLLGALATGYTWALRDRTLDEQEAIRAAALVARDQAEQALRQQRGALPPRGPARPAHRAAQPGAVRRPARRDLPHGRAGGADRARASSTSTRSRRSTTASATRWATSCWSPWPSGWRSLADELGQLVARFGGDEFVVLIEDTTGTDDAVKVADRILAAVRRTVPCGRSRPADHGQHRHRRAGRSRAPTRPS